jgi:hypothetical protein
MISIKTNTHNSKTLRVSETLRVWDPGISQGDNDPSTGAGGLIKKTLKVLKTFRVWKVGA